MITILLKQIIDLLSGWISSFTQYASDVLEKLGLIEEDTSYLPDIKSDCDDIKDNTAAVITPVNNIKNNTDSINTSAATTASNTTAIMNQAVTIGTNSGRAAAFAEDCANNTLDIKDKIITIASDTTQIRANGNTLVNDIAEIKDLMQYYFLTNIVTEDSEGDICNFDTDLEDYLQKAIVTIPADVNGISSIDVTKCGKNFLSKSVGYFTDISTNLSDYFFIKAGTYTFSMSNVLNATSWRFNIRMKNSNGVDLSTEVYKPNNSFVWNNTVVGWINGDNTTNKSVVLDIVTDCYIRITFSTGDTSSSTVFEDCILEIGNTATIFDGYKSVVDTISLGSSITDGGELDLLTGLLKINTTPATYSQLSPIVIRTYKGVNNIYSDSGSMKVTYRESLKHYLDKNNQ